MLCIWSQQDMITTQNIKSSSSGV